MDYISINKLAKNFKIDVYQLKSYIEYLHLEIIEVNKIDSISTSNLEILEKFINVYSRNEISYIISHNIEPFFNGTLLLNLRKKYNLNEKQFKSKISSCGLEFKYIYNNEECKKFDDFINNSSNLNRAEIRDLKYIKEGWIPLRSIVEKTDISIGTLDSYVKKLKINVYKPLHQLSFISKEDEEKLIDFILSFNTSNERKLYLQEKTCMEKYGVENPSLSDSARKKISEKVKISCTDERQRKIENSKIEKYGSISIYYIYEYDDFKFNSSWELYYYIYQKEILNNKIFRGKIFEYKINEKIHKYECDFIINDVENVEIKGNQYLDENENLKYPYKDYKNKKQENMQNIWNAKFQCMKDNNVKVISKDEIEPIIKIVDKKYTPDYVQLFKKDLSFPYPNDDFKNNSDMGIIRHFHKSIYHARRCKNISPFEAWNNKNLVKKSALNRLKYVGSCRPNDVIQGFNVAKIAPKVSVFNSKLAEDLIHKYLGDVKIIYDPFSGFSGRMIGAFRCDKMYIGKDLNETHVEESNQIIKYLEGEKLLSVIQEDIFESNIIYSENSALFTCSPYENKEIWNNENDRNLTCDEWIDICLDKYKVNKYLFVVDYTKKYKEYIVDIISNKSHFGMNNEYIIFINKSYLT